MSRAMELRPAPAEVLNEFTRVSERLQQEFDLDQSPGTEKIDAYFDAHGYYRHPVVSIPYTPEGFAAARKLSTETRYPLPFVTQKFSKTHNFENVHEPGMGFSLPAYRLNFMNNLSERATELYGEDVSDRIVSTLRAHELAHSVFHAEPLIQTNGDGTKIYEPNVLSGTLHTVFGKRGGPAYTPIWIEEAFATYVAADVFRDDFSDGSGHRTAYAGFGPGEFELSETYVMRSLRWPDLPGSIAGSVAGQTLENLDAKIPGVISGIEGIARGEVDPAEYRTDLRQKVGRQLFGLMFSRHSYNTWTNIYNRVNDL